jgi:negative regulator of flagellin synthesis FlgM
MTMEIRGYPNQPPSGGVDGVAATGNRPAATTTGAKGPSPDDRVSLTNSAALLAELEKEIATLPVVDTGRVEATQRALATGTYELVPPRIADKLLALELLIGGKD